MTPPVLDVFIGRDGSAWRLYFAPSSWRPGHFANAEGGSVFPVGRPDVAGLDRFMRKVGSRIDRRRTGDGGVEILARGRAALAVAAWLEHLVAMDETLRESELRQVRSHRLRRPSHRVPLIALHPVRPEPVEAANASGLAALAVHRGEHLGRPRGGNVVVLGRDDGVTAHLAGWGMAHVAFRSRTGQLTSLDANLRATTSAFVADRFALDVQSKVAAFGHGKAAGANR